MVRIRFVVKRLNANVTITLFQPRLAPLSIVGIWLEYGLPSNV